MCATRLRGRVSTSIDHSGIDDSSTCYVDVLFERTSGADPVYVEAG